MKKILKSTISIIMLFILSTSLFACGNSIESKKDKFLEVFYEDEYNSTRNEIVTSLLAPSLDSKTQTTGFYSGNLIDNYEEKIEQHINKKWLKNVNNIAYKIQTYAETKNISFSYDEAKDITMSLIIHLVENFDYYYSTN